MVPPLIWLFSFSHFFSPYVLLRPKYISSVVLWQLPLNASLLFVNPGYVCSSIEYICSTVVGVPSSSSTSIIYSGSPLIVVLLKMMLSSRSR